MPSNELKGENVPIKIWAPIEEVESQALDQIKNVAKLPWVFHHVAVMADCHFGIGATIGSVIAMKNALSPATVGVDQGCGMGAMKTSLKASDLPDNLGELRNEIERLIPVGFSQHADAPSMPEAIKRDRTKLFESFGNLTLKVQDREKKAMCQCGTLGGGNHFIELCLDADDVVWLMLHSGSRNIGKELAEFHIAVARKLAHNEMLPDRDLAVFLAGTEEMRAYRHDLMWAQEYAFLNRRIMFELYKQAVLKFMPEAKFGDPILCHHNYVSEETHFGEEVLVTRKGAIRARRTDVGIIPGSMGTKSYIVRGLGNAESYESASHGAGRRMSRGRAKKMFSLDDLREQTKGVECRKDAGVIDEIPGAYKDIDKVMENQKDLVEILHVLKQILCVKG